MACDGRVASLSEGQICLRRIKIEIIFIFMKRVIQLQLKPTSNKRVRWRRRFVANKACNWLAERAFERKLANRFGLHKLYYYELRARFGLPSQMACLVSAQVAAAYKRDKSKQVSFRPLASMP